MHRLLSRQVLKTLGRPDGHSPEVQRLLEAVNAAYEQADEDRAMLERSMELSSGELVGRNAELTAAEEKYRSIFENATEGIFQLSPDGHIRVANPALSRILGCDGDHARNGGDASLVLFRVLTAAQWEQLHQSGALEVSDLEIQRLDGVPLVVSMSLRVQRDRGGQILRIDGMLRDVTARFRAESERNELNNKLVDASRRAGRAEVATGVLHNVGNVLNSLNVSVTLLARRVEGLKLPSLDKAARKLRDMAPEQRAHFVSADPRGSRIPEFLVQLAENLTADQQALAAEVASVQQHLDHVKGVISSQQSYARGSGVQERVPLVKVLDETLRLEADAIESNGLTVLRELNALPDLLVDKHQVLQILVNLTTNAVQSMAQIVGRPRALTFRSGWMGTGTGRLFVEVHDVGLGIAPENLTRIFNHGFTTKSDGHGFGLHASANVAKAMGGALSASSAGVGQGACFRLELPASCIVADSATQHVAAWGNA